MLKPNILIVEDNFLIALSVKKLLENSGYHIAAIVDSGEQAIRKAVELKPDLIIMDISLKTDLNGIEAVKRIREAFPVPVIYLTGNDNLLKQENVSDPCINKPFVEEDIKQSVTSLLGA